MDEMSAAELEAVESVLDGRAAYDEVGARVAAVVREAWDQRREVLLAALDVAAELLAASRSWSEADPAGRVIYRDAAEVARQRRLHAADEPRFEPSYHWRSLEKVRLLRGDQSISTTLREVKAQEAERRLFTVHVQGHLRVPSFLLDSVGRPRWDLGPLLRPLMDSGMSRSQMWVWLVSRSLPLSGLVPHEAAANIETAARARMAAERVASCIRL